MVLTAFVDSENQQSPAITFQNTVLWINNLGNPINWVNNLSQVVSWLGPASSGAGYFLYKSDAKMFGKYLGMTITSTSTPFTINGFEFEHELRARF